MVLDTMLSDTKLTRKLVVASWDDLYFFFQVSSALWWIPMNSCVLCSFQNVYSLPGFVVRKSKTAWCMFCFYLFVPIFVQFF